MKKLFCAFFALSGLCFIPSHPQAQNIFQNGQSNNPQQGYGGGFNSQFVARGIVEGPRPLNVIEIPDQFVNPNLPPYWVRVCRPDNPTGSSSAYVTPIYSNADRGGIRPINDRGCTFIPFTKSLVLSTGAGSHEVEYQFLGRS